MLGLELTSELVHICVQHTEGGTPAAKPPHSTVLAQQ